MSETLLVRRMCAADAAVLRALAAEESPGYALAQECERSEIWARVAAIDADSPALGYAFARRCLDEMELLGLATLPEARRRGVARALTSSWIAQAADAGVRRLTLEVRASNAAALSLYASLGFVGFNRREGYYRGGEDALELELYPRRGSPRSSA